MNGNHFCNLLLVAFTLLVIFHGPNWYSRSRLSGFNKCVWLFLQTAFHYHAAGTHLIPMIDFDIALGVHVDIRILRVDYLLLLLLIYQSRLRAVLYHLLRLWQSNFMILFLIIFFEMLSWWIYQIGAQIVLLTDIFNENVCRLINISTTSIDRRPTLALRMTRKGL